MLERSQTVDAQLELPLPRNVSSLCLLHVAGSAVLLNIALTGRAAMLDGSYRSRHLVTAREVPLGRIKAYGAGTKLGSISLSRLVGFCMAWMA